MRTFRGGWSTAGLVAGFAGLATSYFVAMAMTIRDSPVVAVAEGVIRLTPGPVAEKVISVLGHRDKPFLVGVILVLVALLFVWAGRLAARAWGAPLFVFVPLAVLGGVAVSAQRGASSLDVLPVAVGFVTWLICLSLLTEPLRRAAAAEGEAVRPAGERPGPVVRSRRSFLLRGAAIAAASRRPGGCSGFPASRPRWCRPGRGSGSTGSRRG